MKKIIAIVLTLTFLSTGAFAFKAMRPSPIQTVSAAITAKPGYFHGLLFSHDSNYDAKINVFDNATEASGRKLILELNVKSTSRSDRANTASFDPPLEYFNGLYVTVEGINAEASTPVVNYQVFFNTEND